MKEKRLGVGEGGGEKRGCGGAKKRDCMQSVCPECTFAMRMELESGEVRRLRISIAIVP